MKYYLITFQAEDNLGNSFFNDAIQGSVIEYLISSQKIGILHDMVITYTLEITKEEFELYTMKKSATKP